MSRPPRPPVERDRCVLLSKKQLEGARAEARAWPRQLSERAVASKAGVSGAAVSGWRQNPHYLRAVEDLIAKKLEDRLAASDPPSTKARKRRNLENLEVDARNDWKGPTKCMVCGEVFTDPTSYVRHIVNQHPGVGYFIPPEGDNQNS